MYEIEPTMRRHDDALSKQSNFSCRIKALNNLWCHAAVSNAALSFSTQRQTKHYYVFPAAT